MRGKRWKSHRRLFLSTRNFKCLPYLRKSRIPAQLYLSVISGLLTFCKWPKISTRNPERSGYGIFTVSTVPKFYLPYPIPISIQLWPTSTLLLLLLYSSLLYSSLLYSSLLYSTLLLQVTFVASSSWIPWTERGKAFLGEESLLESTWMQTGLPLMQGKSFPLPCLLTSHCRKLPVCLVYPCRCSRVLVLIPEFRTLVLVPES